jgi:hypothetical protein
MAVPVAFLILYLPVPYLGLFGLYEVESQLLVGLAVVVSLLTVKFMHLPSLVVLILSPPFFLKRLDTNVCFSVFL